MGIVIRQSIKTIVVTIIGAILGLLINLISIKIFSKTEFGFTQNLVKIAIQLCYFCTIGFNFTLIVYGQKYPPDHPKRASFLTISLVIPLIASIIISALYFVAKPVFINSYHSGDETWMEKYFVLFPLLTFFSATLLWMESYLMSIYKTSIQSFAREILNRLVYLLLIGLYAYSIINYTQFIWWYVLLYLIPILFLGYFMKKFKGFKLGYTKGDFTKSEILHFLGFSFNQTFVVISIVLIVQIDALLIGPLSYEGLEALAIYGMAAFAIGIVKNPIRAISAAAMPALSNSYQKRDLKELRRNFIKSVTTIQMLVILFALGVVLCITEIQYFINQIREGYELMAPLILILLVGHSFDMAGGLNMEVITLSKYYKYNTYFSLLGLGVIVALIYFSIDKWGLIGVAWASTAGLCVYAVLKSWFLYKKFKIQPYTASFFKILGIGVVSLAATYWIPLDHLPLVSILVKGGLYTLIFVGLFIRLKISPDINEVIGKYLPSRR